MFCSSCKQELPENKFSWMNKENGVRQTRCKFCLRSLARANYAKHRSRIVAENKRRIAKVRQANREKLDTYKREHGCKYCHENEPVALDMHHKIGKKEFTISSSRGMQREWHVLLNEIAKCEVVCACCHRKLHAGFSLSPVVR